MLSWRCRARWCAPIARCRRWQAVRGISFLSPGQHPLPVLWCGALGSSRVRYRGQGDHGCDHGSLGYPPRRDRGRVADHRHQHHHGSNQRDRQPGLGPVHHRPGRWRSAIGHPDGAVRTSPRRWRTATGQPTWTRSRRAPMGIRHARGDGDRRPRVVRHDVDGLSAGIEPTRVRRWVRAVNPGVVPDAARWAGGLVRRGRPGDPATPHSHPVPPRHQLRQRSGSVRAGQRLSYRPTVRSDCPIASTKRRFTAHDGAALVLAVPVAARRLPTGPFPRRNERAETSIRRRALETAVLHDHTQRHATFQQPG